MIEQVALKKDRSLKIKIDGSLNKKILGLWWSKKADEQDM